MGSTRYGLAYKGSKNKIAEWIIDTLPPADNFYDLFCGGCAVSHVALLSGKYKNVIMNDIDARLPKLFVECLQGKHTLENHKEWISREDFYKLRGTDALIDLVWSFGNNGRDYLYGKDKEPFKKALHYAIAFRDFRQLDDFGVHIDDIEETDIYKRYLGIKKKIKDTYSKRVDMEMYERLQSVENIRNLDFCSGGGIAKYPTFSRHCRKSKFSSEYG